MLNRSHWPYNIGHANVGSGIKARAAERERCFGTTSASGRRPGRNNFRCARRADRCGPFGTPGRADGGQRLGDLGAAVIKVEHPDGGDDTRGWGPAFANGTSTYFLAANRNKYGVLLDLSRPEDRALAQELALRADVLVENFRPGTMERFGLGYESLKPDNSALVYANISASGSEGVGATLGGYDFLIPALSGLMSVTGAPDGELTKAVIAVVDVLAGLHIQVGVLAALAARGRTGVGQRVAVSLMGAALARLVNQGTAWLSGGVDGRRMGNAHPGIVPCESFLAADRTLVVAVGNDGQFQHLCDVAGWAQLAEDARFRTNGDRQAARTELHQLLAEIFAHEPAASWVEKLARVQVPCGLINNVVKGFAYPEELGIRATVELDGVDGQKIAQIANPIELSHTPVGYRLPPPRLGEHDGVVRRWLRGPNTDFGTRTNPGRIERHTPC